MMPSRPRVSSRPVLLDTYCGAGGAAMGYWLAGFDVVGVDINPQPRYPFRFIQGDAIDHIRSHGREYDAIHASAPCQPFTAYRRRGRGVGDGYQDLIAQTREALRATDRPYIIENVPGSPLLPHALLMCGSSFKLDIRRHRLFETNFPFTVPGCDHGWQRPRFPQATNRRNLRRTVEIGVWRIPLSVQRRAMGGCGWMTLDELSEAVPPRYTEYIGWQLRWILETRHES